MIDDRAICEVLALFCHPEKYSIHFDDNHVSLQEAEVFRHEDR